MCVDSDYLCRWESNKEIVNTQCKQLIQLKEKGIYIYTYFEEFF